MSLLWNRALLPRLCAEAGDPVMERLAAANRENRRILAEEIRRCRREGLLLPKLKPHRLADPLVVRRLRREGRADRFRCPTCGTRIPQPWGEWGWCRYCRARRLARRLLSLLTGAAASDSRGNR